MLDDELEMAIQELLTERPNQDKPTRRRRNKTKDLKKQLLSGKLPYYGSIVSTLNEEVAQDTKGGVISYVRVHVTPIFKGVYLGVSDRGYDDINGIAESLGLLTGQLYLEPYYLYNYRTERFEEVEWQVYQKGYELEVDFLDEDFKRVYVKGWGVFSSGKHIVTECTLQNGVYGIDEVRDVLTGLIKKPIRSTSGQLSTLSEVKDYIDSHGHQKYGEYMSLVGKYFDRSKWYKKLMDPVNSRLRSKDDLNRLATLYNRLGELDDFESEPQYDELITKVTAPRKEQDPQDYYY